MRKKYTCREVIFFFFSPGWRLGREQVLSYFSNERKGAEGFQFLEYYKGHWHLSLPQLGGCPDFGSELLLPPNVLCGQHSGNFPGADELQKGALRGCSLPCHELWLSGSCWLVSGRFRSGPWWEWRPVVCVKWWIRSTGHWSDFPFLIFPFLPVQKRHGRTGESPVKGHEGDEVTAAPLPWRLGELELLSLEEWRPRGD